MCRLVASNAEGFLTGCVVRDDAMKAIGRRDERIDVNVYTYCFVVRPRVAYALHMYQTLT